MHECVCVCERVSVCMTVCMRDHDNPLNVF